MKAGAQVWPPPEKEKGAQENLGALECANPSGIGSNNDTRIVPLWQRGLNAELLAQIARHRSSKPTTQLPAAIQREVGRRWREYARGTQ